ncbi:MAG: hypothetical protein HEQ40_12320 [Lacibacter sp.]
MKRTLSAFNEWDIDGSNWWIIPAVQQRWNKKISGNKDEGIPEYISNKILYSQPKGSLLSVGSGTCTLEFVIAKLLPAWSLTCTDIAGELMKQAQKEAKKKV